MLVTGEPCQPPAHLSPSSIGTWQQCPLKFRYSRIEKIPEPSTEAQLMGTFVHEVLENFYEMPSEERTQINARSTTARLWNEKWAEEVEVLNLSPEGLHRFRWQSWWCIEALWELEDPQVLQPAAVEQRLTMQVDEAKVLGIVDRYNHDDQGRIVVSDYKTGKKPRQRYEAEKRFQLLVYTDMLQQHLDAEVAVAELLYLKEKVKWAIEPTKAELTRMRTTVVRVWNELQQACSTGTFEAKRGILCDWCSYKTFCPAWQHSYAS